MKTVNSNFLPFKGDKELYQNKGIYPFELQDIYLTDDAVSLYSEWLKKRKIKWGPKSSPCLPIAKVGPSLVFGHCSKEGIKSSDWPITIFQHVIIPEKQYAELSSHLCSIFGLGSEEESHQVPFIIPDIDSKDEYLDFILNELIIEDSLRPFLLGLKSRNGWDLLDLPHGYREYYYYLKGMASIVPIALAQIKSDYFELIPKSLQERYQAICFGREGSTAYVAIAETSSSTEFEDLAIARSNGAIKEVVLCLSAQELISEKRRDYLKGKKKEDVQFAKTSQKNSMPMEGKGNLEIDVKLVESLDPRTGSHSPEVLFQWILYEAISRDATDIHIEYYNGRGRIRFRMDGDLVVFHEPTEEIAMAIVTVCKNVCSMSSNIYDNQDAAFSVKYDEIKINLRVNAIPFRKHSQKLALRILPKKNSLTVLDKLGLSPDHLGILRRAITRKQGLILITGPTGEGKTTTLYASLSEINKPNINIQTVEDPIERELEGINQTAVDLARGITFQSIMRSIVRQDPNVILLGEIRDQESAELAIEAALTGHLVFSTLHANSAIKAIQRLMQLGVPHYLLADSLILIQAQRLIKRLCNRCKKPRGLSVDEEILFSNQGCSVPQTLCDPKGCVHCDNTGYIGRIAIMEMVPVGKPLAEMILKKESYLKIQEYTQTQGGRNLFQDALLKVAEGITSLDQAIIFEEVWI